jgi:hypothetical protein
VAAGSAHPLVQVRVARVAHAQARWALDRPAALASAGQMAEAARRAGLLEPLAEALWLQAQASADPTAAAAWMQQAEALAAEQGFTPIASRASTPREWGSAAAGR